jgi:hypothetical protein
MKTTNLDKEMNEIWKKLPDDIINEILIIKNLHDQHNKFKNCLKDINLSASLKKMRYLEFKYKKFLYNTSVAIDIYDDIILKYTNSSERLDLIYAIEKCNCCKRHQTKRPDYNMFNEMFVPEYSTSPYREHKCRCICRHMAREICRAQWDEVDERL